MRRGRGARGLPSAHLGSGRVGLGQPAVPPGPAPLSSLRLGKRWRGEAPRAWSRPRVTGMSPTQGRGSGVSPAPGKHLLFICREAA